MQNKNLHIISFDVPYPPTYGGVVDVFYKIKALHSCGVKIHLHCYQYGRKKAEELEKYCSSVTYYKRKTNRLLLFRKTPFIVEGRKSRQLAARLAQDDFPVLCEGLHTAFILNEPQLHGRKIFVRTHNIEHDYYRTLSFSERTFTRQWYLKREANKLKAFEKILSKASGLLAISQNDKEYFLKINPNTQLIFPFHPNEKLMCKTGKGNYAIYHGNLKISENYDAVMFLLKNVFTTVQVPLLIAGNQAPDFLRKRIDKLKHVKLVENFDPQQLFQLLQDAQLHVMPTFQSTGVKIKLINALFVGRHVLVNSKMLSGTGLDDLCYKAEDQEDWEELVMSLMKKEFTEADISKRENLLNENFNNNKNARLIIDHVFSSSS